MAAMDLCWRILPMLVRFRRRWVACLMPRRAGKCPKRALRFARAWLTKTISINCWRFTRGPEARNNSQLRGVSQQKLSDDPIDSFVGDVLEGQCRVVRYRLA